MVLLTVASLLLAAVVAVRTDATRRTLVFVGLERTWYANWPLERGKWLPLRMQRLFEPLVPIRAELEPGVTMQLDPSDHVSINLLVSGYWETGTWSLIDKHFKAGGTFIDVGAHIGYYSLKAASIAGSGGRVIAIEPNPDTLVKLRNNIRLSGATTINVLPIACSDKVGELELFAGSTSNTGVASFSRENAQQAGPGGQHFRVQTRPLDSIVRESAVSRVDVIKLDVEGAELMVLKGATETLARFSPLIILELKEYQLKALGSSGAQLLGFLQDHGYRQVGAAESNLAFSK
jgi:FkbM family methyltransferase